MILRPNEQGLKFTFPLNSDNLIHENLPENASITISIKYLDEIKVEAKVCKTRIFLKLTIVCQTNWTGESEKDQNVIPSLAERLSRCNALLSSSLNYKSVRKKPNWQNRFSKENYKAKTELLDVLSGSV